MRLTLTLKLRLWLAIAVTAMAMSWAVANEKGGMPDLGQEEQTCLPTSTANLIIWFGTHGYPNLIEKGDSKENGFAHTVHAIMAATKAQYRTGTRTTGIAAGIRKYVKDAGYGCDVEYRGLDWGMGDFSNLVKDAHGNVYVKDFKPPASFSQDWLKQNDDPNKGFILMLDYCKYNPETDTYTNAINAGHAVTLVNAEPDMILIHDPAHYRDESGRKILTPLQLTSGTFNESGLNLPVAGLLRLSGSELGAPPDSGVMLTGAVCLTMHAEKEKGKVVSPVSAPGTTIGLGKGSAAPPVDGPAPTQDRSWGMWLFDLIFKT